MNTEKFRILAAVIAAHPGHQIVGRTRLQKTIKLLQRLGLPTDYGYMIHFYGPYSEDLQAEVGLLEHFGLVEEIEQHSQENRPYYVLRAKQESALPEVDQFREAIQIMSNASPIALELAATYDAFREQELDHGTSLQMLRLKKGEKCANGNEERALVLLHTLGLPTR